MKFIAGVILFLFFCRIPVTAQIDTNSVPLIGAQVFIEPGQKPEEIDRWFQILKENEMPICRIRMFESYMRKEDGTWDFTLFDLAFESAAKYDIKIFATLFPFTKKTDIGGFKFPRDEEHLISIANFIEHVVPHFKKYSSLFGWVLINEPGSVSVPKNKLAEEKFKEWLTEHPYRNYTEKGYPILMDLTEHRFLKDYNTWYLSWIATEIRKYDQKSHLHVNSHAIFDNACEYDFPAWREFLGSIGGSAHPSWHFGSFNRSQYALAMSANSEIIRSGSGNLPWIMTEIQGGNNTYSGMGPFCPTAEEITQWLWVTIGTEAKSAIFWTLNPRASGIEAGEWAMLTFQDKASDRLIAAKKVAQTINNNKELFSQSKVIDSGINILYTRESMWAEKAMSMPSKQKYEGRENGAVMKSTLGYIEALSEMGINCNLKEFSEFDFDKNNYKEDVIILSNQLSIPNYYKEDLEDFVSKGGKLIVDGLTAFFDENLHNTMETGFTFEKLFGGNISEFKLVDNLFDVYLSGQNIPAHLWQGTIAEGSGEVISSIKNMPVGLKNKFGDGEVVWIPSLLGLGGRIAHDYRPLGNWLIDEIEKNIDRQLIRFKKQIPGMLMKTMQSGNSLISIVINKSDKEQKLFFVLQDKKLHPNLIFSGNKKKDIENSAITIQAEETLVIKWK